MVVAARRNGPGPGPLALAFVTASTGELHCLLPLLCLTKERHPEFRIVVAFQDAGLRDRFEEDTAYVALLKELDAELLEVSDVLRRFVTYPSRVRLIFKEFGPTPPGSLPVLLKQACPRAALVLFPHAYALHASGVAPQATPSAIVASSYDQRAIDAVLLGSPMDVEPWTRRLALEKIHVAGATGYTAWWAAIMRRHAEKQLSEVCAAAKGKRLIFLTTRGPHPLFLTRENYEYLVTEAVDVVLSQSDTYLVIKPHPREDAQHLRALLAAISRDRYQVVNLNTLALATVSAVTVSLWSSAILDSVAMGTPTIEFHRFHAPFPQCVRDENGTLSSIYTTLGLALKADSRAALVGALDFVLSNRAELLATQRTALESCFPGNEEQPTELVAALQRLVNAQARSAPSSASVGAMFQLALLAVRDVKKRLAPKWPRRARTASSSA